MKLASLTFDDCSIRHYKIARMLQKMNVRATFYLITGLDRYNAKASLAKEPKLVEEMRQMGHEIGSHGHTHRNLTLLSAEELAEECMESRETLRMILDNGEGQFGLAYPYGAFNDQVVDVVRRYFHYGRTMGNFNRWNEVIDPYKIGSMGIRHIFKFPFKKLRGDVNLMVLTFHDESPYIIRVTVDFLKRMKLEVLPVGEVLRIIFPGSS